MGAGGAVLIALLVIYAMAVIALFSYLYDAGGFE